MTATGQAGWIVGVGEAGRRLGLDRARHSGRPFLGLDRLDDRRLDRLAARAGSLFLVSAELTQRDVLDVTGRVRAASHGRPGPVPGLGCPVGFLHARDLAALQALDARQRAARTSAAAPALDLLLDATLTEPPARPAEGLSVLPYRGVSSRQLLDRGPVRLLALTSHGTSDLLHLDQDFLCGRSPGHARGRLPGLQPLPACVTAEAAPCFWKPAGTALPAAALPAEHVFINSCGSSGYDSGDFGDDFSIWYGVLDGMARSFVGTIRWKEGHWLEGLLYRHLLAAGHRLGTSVEILNSVLPGHQLEAGPVFTLIGDPEDRAAEPRPAGPLPVATSGDNRLPGTGAFQEFTVREADLLAAYRAGRLLMFTSGGPPAAVSAVPAPDGRSLHCFLSAFEDLGPAGTLRCVDYRDRWARAVRVREALTGPLDPGLGMQGIYPEKVRKGIRTNLEGRLLNLARQARQARTDGRAAAKLLRTCDRMDADVERADQEIAGWLRERIRTTSYRFSEHYGDAFTLGEGRPDRTCPVCAGPAVARVQVSLLAPAVRRTELICPACGGVADSPDGEFGLRIGGDRVIRAGRPATVPLTITHHGRAARTGFCFIGLRRAADHGVPVTPGPTRVTVPAGGRVDVDFTLDLAPEIARHQYGLQAVLVSSGQVYLGRRPVWVGHESGSQPAG